MDIIWINQDGTYTFSLPIGKMAVVITYHGIYPHYSASSGIAANQLGGDSENEPYLYTTKMMELHRQ